MNEIEIVMSDFNSKSMFKGYQYVNGSYDSIANTGETLEEQVEALAKRLAQITGAL
jgi:hypothetical protein